MGNCHKCGEKAVFAQQNQLLCKNHFLDYFENKVIRTIKKYELFARGDRICVAASGGKDSLSLLYMSMMYCREHNIDFFALALEKECPIWSNDKELKQQQVVKVLTTKEVIELFN